MNEQTISTPTLLLNVAQAKQNIQQMAAKAHRCGVRFRPHFKTHQSAEIGQWFRDAGVTAVTVSSVEMAVYFANHGWDDITIAFPVNPRQIAAINELASRVTLHLLVESAEVVSLLAAQLTQPVQVWIEMDVGYGRSGVTWHDLEGLTAVAAKISQAPQLTLTGLLTHAGHSYLARSVDEILTVHQTAQQRLLAAQAHLRTHGLLTQLSIGDTPTCAVAQQFDGIDEIRPGNFVFFDLMQHQIGACTLEQIAVAVACPIVAIYPEREQIVVYGGAVHLSKEFLRRDDGTVSYGRVALLTKDGWRVTRSENTVKTLSQEHGILHASPELCRDLKRGDLLAIIPVHSCLMVNLLRQYATLDGQFINSQ